MRSGSPSPCHALVISWPSIVPTVRLTLRIGRSMSTWRPSVIAGWARRISSTSSASSSPWSCSTVRYSDWPYGFCGTARIGLMSSPSAFQWSIAARVSSAST